MKGLLYKDISIMTRSFKGNILLLVALYGVLILVCTPSRGQRNKSKKYLKPLSNKGHAFPTVSERQGYAGDV